MLLCKGLSSISEWKPLHKLVWWESNASWQWIVPIDSTTLNHFLFTEPHACTLFRFFFHVCEMHPWATVYFLLDQSKSMPEVSQTGLNDLPAGKKKSSAYLCDADWEWLMTGGAAGQEGQLSCWLMKQRLRHRQHSARTNRRHIAALTSDPTD